MSSYRDRTNQSSSRPSSPAKTKGKNWRLLTIALIIVGLGVSLPRLAKKAEVEKTPLEKAIAGSKKGQCIGWVKSQGGVSRCYQLKVTKDNLDIFIAPREAGPVRVFIPGNKPPDKMLQRLESSPFGGALPFPNLQYGQLYKGNLNIESGSGVTGWVLHYAEGGVGELKVHP